MTVLIIEISNSILVLREQGYTLSLINNVKNRMINRYVIQLILSERLR